MGGGAMSNIRTVRIGTAKYTLTMCQTPACASAAGLDGTHCYAHADQEVER
jgi:hypothetical protein